MGYSSKGICFIALTAILLFVGMVGLYEKFFGKGRGAHAKMRRLHVLKAAYGVFVNAPGYNEKEGGPDERDVTLTPTVIVHHVKGFLEQELRVA